MGTSYDELNMDVDLYNEIVCRQNVYEMGIMEAMQFDLPHQLYDSSESSWKSSSSEDFLTLEGFDQQSVNSWPQFQHSVYHAQSAFRLYRKSDSNATMGPFKSGQILHKRCFSLLCKIDEKIRFERERTPRPLPPSASASMAAAPKKRSAAEHMIAERGRRIRFRQHFSNLYSLLPRNSKNSRNSILANTTAYVKELKLRLAELEQQNQILQASVPSNISIKGQELHNQLLPFSSENTIIYNSNEITLGQSKKNPCLINIKTTMQIDLVTCPTSLLMEQIDQLRREQLEILSINSSTDPLQFHSNILVKPRGPAWNISMWQNLGNKVRESLF